MGCLIEKKTPIITSHCSNKTTMITGIDTHAQLTHQIKGKKWLTSSTVKETLVHFGEQDKVNISNNNNKNYISKQSIGESEWNNCIIHEAPNTMDSFKDKLMNVINELEKGEELKKERIECEKREECANWGDIDINNVLITRINSEREARDIRIIKNY